MKELWDEFPLSCDGVDKKTDEHEVAEALIRDATTGVVVTHNARDCEKS